MQERERESRRMYESEFAFRYLDERVRLCVNRNESVILFDRRRGGMRVWRGGEREIFYAVCVCMEHLTR